LDADYPRKWVNIARRFTARLTIADGAQFDGRSTMKRANAKEIGYSGSEELANV
jgi:cytoskeletal protein CcmA (bactofilin family)